jgi:hypothetical protein
MNVRVDLSPTNRCIRVWCNIHESIDIQVRLDIHESIGIRVVRIPLRARNARPYVG